MKILVELSCNTCVGQKLSGAFSHSNSQEYICPHRDDGKASSMWEDKPCKEWRMSKGDIKARIARAKQKE